MSSNTKTIEMRPLTNKDLALKESNPEDMKFGVKLPPKENEGKREDTGELVLLPYNKPISYAVEAVCSQKNIMIPSDYAIRFSDAPGYYVTEATRKELRGKVVLMCESPGKLCQIIVSHLKSNIDQDITEGLEKLAKNASDLTVADTFVSVGGLTVLLELMERDKPVEWYKEGLAFALQALLDIMMSSNEATWDKLTMAVISRVVSYVNNNPKSASTGALGPALRVLENAISSGIAYGQVEREVTLPILITHVQNIDTKVQQNALALINALLSKAEPSKRKYLFASLKGRQYRDIVLQHVINKKPGERLLETNHELYVMQTLFLNLLDERRLKPIDPQDLEALNYIMELYKIAFEQDSGNYALVNVVGHSPANFGKRDKSTTNRDYHKLGFTNDKNPELDFAVVPPGALALDCMYYLATNHAETYSKIVLESASRTAGEECPFARSSITLVNLLCDILKMGEPPGDQQGRFYPFFFQHEKPFEELFCICSSLVTKTWKEMRAKVEDFEKVFDVVNEQITRALDKKPDNLDILKKVLYTLTYEQIKVLRRQEKSNKEVDELQAKPIQDMRKKLEPDMKDLIKQNRINYLIAGTRFNKFQARGLNLTRVKEKFWFCRLSTNSKIFHYGECEEKATPSPEELPSKINVTGIRYLLTGKDCPHMKDAKGKKPNAPLAFSIVIEKDPPETVDFIAPDEQTFDMWTDGINALLDKPMVSKEAKNDLDTLLHMEIKLKMLEIDGITLPQNQPKIPDFPDDFDFNTLQINGK